MSDWGGPSGPAPAARARGGCMRFGLGALVIVVLVSAAAVWLADPITERKRIDATTGSADEDGAST